MQHRIIVSGYSTRILISPGMGRFRRDAMNPDAINPDAINRVSTNITGHHLPQSLIPNPPKSQQLGITNLENKYTFTSVKQKKCIIFTTRLFRIDLCFVEFKNIKKSPGTYLSF